MKTIILVIVSILIINTATIGQINNLKSNFQPRVNGTINQYKSTQHPSNFQITPKTLTEIYPDTSQCNSNMPCVKPDSGGKLLISKPITSAQYNLRIYDPCHRRTAHYPKPLYKGFPDNKVYVR